MKFQQFNLQGQGQMSHGQYEYEIHEDLILKNVLSWYEVNSFIYWLFITYFYLNNSDNGFKGIIYWQIMKWQLLQIVVNQDNQIFSLNKCTLKMIINN
jgi:hypothetical protein